MTPDKSRQRNLLGGFDVWQQIFPYMGLFYFILGWFAVSVEAFLRHDMGERYFSRMNFLAGLFVLLFFAGIYNVVVGGISSFSGGSGFSGLIFLVLLAYIGMGIFHFMGHRRRNRQGDPLHSLYQGTSWFSPLFNAIPFLTTERFERVVEPLLVLVLSFLLFKVDAVLGTWLFFSAAALAVHTGIRLENERNVFLDLRDQAIEANFLREGMQGDKAAEERGIRFADSTKQLARSTAKEMTRRPSFAQEMQATNPTVADALAALSPELQAMMNPLAANDGMQPSPSPAAEPS